MLAIMLIMIVLLVYRIVMIKQIEQTQVAKDVASYGSCINHFVLCHDDSGYQ